MGSDYGQGLFGAGHTQTNESAFGSTPMRTASIAIVTGLVIFVTTLGNTLVIAAFIADRRIRLAIGNWFILNLSVCDLLTGVAVLPFNTQWVIVGSWLFGEAFCKLWLILDFSVTHVSVLSIIFISLDRYWMVTKTSRYAVFLSRRRAVYMIATAWITVVLYYTAVTLLWAPITKESPIDYSEDCEMDAVFNIYFTIVQILLEMAIPLAVIAYLNSVVYAEIKRRSRAFACRRPTRTAGPPALFFSRNSVQPAARDDDNIMHADGCVQPVKVLPCPGKATADDHGSAGGDPPVSDLSSFPGAIDEGPGSRTTDNRSHLSDVSKRSSAEGSVLIGAVPPCTNATGFHDDSGELLSIEEASEVYDSTEQPARFKPRAVTGQLAYASPSIRSSARGDRLASDKGARCLRIEFKKHRKAAITMAVLVSVFVLCWLPYHIASAVNVICNGCVSDAGWETVNYLLWCNSTLNPFLYGITNVRFRRNFSKFFALAKFPHNEQNASRSRVHVVED